MILISIFKIHVSKGIDEFCTEKTSNDSYSIDAWIYGSTQTEYPLSKYYPLEEDKKGKPRKLKMATPVRKTGNPDYKDLLDLGQPR